MNHGDGSDDPFSKGNGITQNRPRTGQDIRRIYVLSMNFCSVEVWDARPFAEREKPFAGGVRPRSRSESTPDWVQEAV